MEKHSVVIAARAMLLSGKENHSGLASQKDKLAFCHGLSQASRRLGHPVSSGGDMSRHLPPALLPAWKIKLLTALDVMPAPIKTVPYPDERSKPSPAPSLGCHKHHPDGRCPLREGKCISTVSPAAALVTAPVGMEGRKGRASSRSGQRRQPPAQPASFQAVRLILLQAGKCHNTKEMM